MEKGGEIEESVEFLFSVIIIGLGFLMNILEHLTGKTLAYFEERKKYPKAIRVIGSDLRKRLFLAEVFWGELGSGQVMGILETEGSQGWSDDVFSGKVVLRFRGIPLILRVS